jgi:CDP-glucose 4,6-dehydratase
MEGFWTGKKVFLTGHTGFKGGWLSLWLRFLGADVTGFSTEPPTTPSLFEVAKIGEIVDDHRGDVRDRSLLERCVQSVKPEIVFHLAAQPLVRLSYLNPVETYETNVMGTVNLLEAVRLTKSVRVVIVITSDKCYENQEWPWAYRENESLGGRDPYSNSKACAELVVASYRQSFFSEDAAAKVATVRAGNVYGGGDWALDRIVPDAIRCFVAGRPLEVRNPSSVRPWQHVLEPLAGYLRLAEALWSKKTNVTALNFGPRAEDEQPVSWLAERMCEMWGPNATWKSAVGKHAHEAHLLRLDSSLAQKELMWRPLCTLAEGLDLTMRWYKAWHAGGDMRGMSLEHIENHQRKETKWLSRSTT